MGSYQSNYFLFYNFNVKENVSANTFFFFNDSLIFFYSYPTIIFSKLYNLKFIKSMLVLKFIKSM